MQTLNVIRLAQQLLLPKVANARCIVDATAGNGKDTLFLAKNSPSHARLYAFDIQQSAIEVARKGLLEQQLDDKVQWILDSHANSRLYVKEHIDVAMFNLGYLPGNSHETMTKATSTIEAVSNIVEDLSIGGIISIVAYPGHPHGQEEHQAVRSYLMGLPQQCFTVVCMDMINHSHCPPVLYLIEKVKSTPSV